MGVEAIILVRLEGPVTDRELESLRGRLRSAFGLEEAYFHEPGLLAIETKRTLRPVREMNGVWLNLNIEEWYYSRDYRRGNVPLLLRLAAWLEEELPGCEVWYGHDAGDGDFVRLDAKGRVSLSEAYKEHGVV